MIKYTKNISPVYQNPATLELKVIWSSQKHMQPDGQVLGLHPGNLIHLSPVFKVMLNTIR